MIILSFKENGKASGEIPDTSFFLEGNNNNLCFLIHGLTGTPKEMTALGNYLNKNGFSVAAPLIEAHNKPISILKRKTWQDFYYSVKQKLLSYINKYENIFVGGLSFGALLSLMLAYEFPHKVKTISCFSPTLFFDGWNMPKSRIFLPFAYKTPFKYYIYFKEVPPYGLKNKSLRAKIAAYYENSSISDNSKAHLYGYPVIPVSCMYQNYLLTKKIISLLKYIRQPIQLFQAKEDDVTSPRNSYFIYRRIGSQEKELIVLENSYHIVIADQERVEIAKKTLNFLRLHSQKDN